MRTSNGRNLRMSLTGAGNVAVPPEALAELQPILPQAYYYPDFTGIDLEYEHALYGEIYSRQPWVTAVIRKRAAAVARLPVNVWDVKGDTRTLDTRSQYAQLIANPTLNYMDPFRFWEWVQTCLDIYGETYLAIHRDNDIPVALLPMHPTRVAIRRNPENGVYDYYFQAGSGINTELVHFPQRDIVPIRYFNPNKLERGLSLLESLRSTIFAEDSSRNAVSAMWANGGRPNLILETPNRLSNVGAQRLKVAFEGAHAGSSNSGKTLVLEDGVTAKPFQVTAVDLELIESRRLNREEICAAFDIAPTLVGILDHATFSNITEQMRAFYRDTMAPVIERIQSAMDQYVGSYWSRANTMKFATDEVMRGDYEVRMEAAHKGVSVAVLTPNEAREMIGLNRMDDPKADKLYCNSAIQELGTPAEMLRMEPQGNLVGPTPDGIEIAPPDNTPVAAVATSLAQQKPKPPHTVPAHVNVVPAKEDRVGRQPNNNNPSTTAKPKHYRAVKSQVGRGKSAAELRAFALQLAAKFPDELDDILASVQLAIAERDRKG